MPQWLRSSCPRRQVDWQNRTDPVITTKQMTARSSILKDLSPDQLPVNENFLCGGIELTDVL